MKKILITFLLLFCAISVFAQPIPGRLNFEEADGSPSVFPYKMYVPNASLTDNNDGTATLTFSAGGGSGTVSTGTARAFGYYPASDTTIDDAPNAFTDGTNVGIGNSAPGARLEVDDTGASNAALSLNVGPGALAVTNKGYVGIGTTAPNNDPAIGAMLNIVTDGTVPPLNAQGNNANLNFLGQDSHDTDSFCTAFLFRKSGGTVGGETIVASGEALGKFRTQGWDGDSWENATALNFFVDGSPSDTIMPGMMQVALVNSSGTSTIRATYKASGNIGFGSTAPFSQFDVSAATGGLQTISRADTTATAADMIGKIQFWNNDTQLSTQQIYGYIQVTAFQTVTTDAAAGEIRMATTRPDTVGGSPVEGFILDERQRVGIGTTAPAARLQLAASGATTGGLTALISRATTVGLAINDFQSVGIGTSVPTAKLQIAATGLSNSSLTALLSRSSTVGLAITNSQNVGIGTTVPLGKLTVSGHIHTTGTAPTVATNDCGSTAQGTVVTKSTDNSGSVTVGTVAPTSCAITFNTTWTNAPNCIAVDDSNILAIKAIATTTKLTISAVGSLQGDVLTWICQGNE